MAWQRIFDQPDPPNLWIVLDEAVLHRMIRYAENHLRSADPTGGHVDAVLHLRTDHAGDTGAHAGLVGSFYIASVRGKPDLLYMDAVEDVTIERSALVRKAAVAFDLVRSDAVTRNDSRPDFESC